VRLLQADALSLPFPSRHFDAAFMAFTLELMDTPEISIVLSELHRVLQTGGGWRSSRFQNRVGSVG